MTDDEAFVFGLICAMPGREYRKYGYKWRTAFPDGDSARYYTALNSLIKNEYVYEVDMTQGGTTTQHPALFPYTPRDLVKKKLYGSQTTNTD